ncbi:hypothetical protein NEILACOT_05569 [Neisseria lactamica ATCC 23970]|uniref:Uncharacterized protein n=1 Tax=Neisseria lactamica ATCC 23970 TaxID=546265 RepID=D0WDD3_NEILA|nr:hypothetical protein NEILACOT_05569 [Neisseria lactamica ATCC 23970]
MHIAFVNGICRVWFKGSGGISALRNCFKVQHKIENKSVPH